MDNNDNINTENKNEDGNQQAVIDVPYTEVMPEKLYENESEAPRSEELEEQVELDVNQGNGIQTPKINQGDSSQIPNAGQDYGNQASNAKQEYSNQVPNTNQGYHNQATNINQRYDNQGYTNHSPNVSQGYMNQNPNMNQGYGNQNPNMNQGYNNQNPNMNQGYGNQNPNMNQGYGNQNFNMNQHYASADPNRYQNGQNLQSNGKATASLVLGIISIVCIFFGYGAIIGIVIGVIGLVLGIAAKKETESGTATTGIVLNIIGLGACALSFLACVACIGLFATV